MKFLYLLLLLPMLALGDNDDDCTGNPHHCGGGSDDPPGIDGTINSDSNSNSDSSSDASSDSDSTSTSGASSNATVDGSGGNSNVSYEYFAFSTQFPQAAGCFGGAQGGASGSGSGGFLGFHILNKDCWLDALAEAETNVDMRARLKCGASKFRDAIAFDQPRKGKQKYCIDYVTKAWRHEIEIQREAISECKKDTGTPVCAYVNGELHQYVD